MSSRRIITEGDRPWTILDTGYRLYGDLIRKAKKLEKWKMSFHQLLRYKKKGRLIE